MEWDSGWEGGGGEGCGWNGIMDDRRVDGRGVNESRGG